LPELEVSILQRVLHVLCSPHPFELHRSYWIEKLCLMSSDQFEVIRWGFGVPMSFSANECYTGDVILQFRSLEVATMIVWLI
jgi:hypothetical protein